MNKPQIAALLIAVAFATPGCLSLGGGEAPPIRRHSIDLPAVDVVEAETLYEPIVVRQFASRGRYELRVLVQDGPGRVSYLEHDRWVEDPAEALTTVVRETLAASGRFAAVAASTSEMQTDLVLDGALLACDVIRPAGGPWRARMAVRLEVTERSTGRMISAMSLESESDLPGASSEGLGAAIGHCIEDIVARAMALWQSGAAASTRVRGGSARSR